jgi:hypothetical protein
MEEKGTYGYDEFPVFANDCTMLATLLQPAKLQGHPLPRHRPLEIPQCCLGAVDLQIDGPDVLLQPGEDVRLGREVFVLGVHLGQFFVRRVGFGEECAAAAFEAVKGFFLCSDSFHAFADVVLPRCVLGEGGWEVGEEFGAAR